MANKNYSYVQNTYLYINLTCLESEGSKVSISSLLCTVFSALAPFFIINPNKLFAPRVQVNPEFIDGLQTLKRLWDVNYCIIGQAQTKLKHKAVTIIMSICSFTGLSIKRSLKLDRLGAWLYFFFYSVDTKRIEEPQYHLALCEVGGPASAGKGEVEEMGEGWAVCGRPSVRGKEEKIKEKLIMLKINRLISKSRLTYLIWDNRHKFWFDN